MINMKLIRNWTTFQVQDFLPIDDKHETNEECFVKVVVVAVEVEGRIALVLLAEAHVAVAVTLGHAGVVHHEEVHLEVVRARSTNLVVF